MPSVLAFVLALLPHGGVNSAVTVEVVRPEGGRLPPGLSVEARRIDGGPAVVQPGASPVLSLGEGAWWVRARAPGFWGEAVEAQVGPQSLSKLLKIRARIFPARSVSLNVEGEAGSQASSLKELRVVFSTPPQSPVSIARGEATCDPRWRCTLPNLELDVQVRSAGFVPEYIWNVKGNVSSLGSFRLRTGASISGFVVVGGGPARDCEVSLLTAEGALLRGSGGSQRDVRERTTPNSRGFFQLAGVPPGRYLVAADCQGVGRATASARVAAGVESHFIRPLAPDRGGELRIRLEPPLAPSGRPWLLSIGYDVSAGATLFHGAAGTDGVWRRSGVAAGRYRARVSDGADRWETHSFEFGASTREIAIEVPVAIVQGQVLWGSSALKAELALGGKYGERRVVTGTDDEGHFEAHVPEALAATASWVVAVRSEEAGVDTTLHGVKAEGGFLKIVVPKTKVAGRLVGAAPTDLKGAIVHLVSESTAQSISRLGKDGAFAFLGVAEGEYALFGESDDKLTERLRVLVMKDGQVSGLVLRLRPSVRAKVRVLTPEGTPVPGAVVGLFPRQAPDAGGMQEITNLEGEADFGLLPEWDAVVLNVAARGYGFHVASYAREKEQPILVTLGRSLAELAVKMDLTTPDVPVLLHRGGFVDVRVLAGAWTRPSDPGFGHNLRELEPGRYRLCRAKAEEYGALLRSGFATARACTDVFLEPSGVATVELP